MLFKRSVPVTFCSNKSIILSSVLLIMFMSRIPITSVLRKVTVVWRHSSFVFWGSVSAVRLNVQETFADTEFTILLSCAVGEKSLQ